MRQLVGPAVQLAVGQLLAAHRPRPRRPASAPPAPRTAGGCTPPGDSPPGWRSTPPAAAAARRRSAAAAPTGAAPGSATIPSSRVGSGRAMRAIVAASNRSVLYSSVAAQPLARLDQSRGSGRTSPCRCRRRQGRSRQARQLAAPCRGAFWRTNITWNSGARLRSRSGCSSSTSFSKGRSWCA